ncbi:hypothetical protein RZS08_36060, partial [Arthrospira platensis SPKY1]|nr:hypothetical protein [Arthrospira platensis SPKY1]
MNTTYQSLALLLSSLALISLALLPGSSVFSANRRLGKDFVEAGHESGAAPVSEDKAFFCYGRLDFGRIPLFLFVAMFNMASVFSLGLLVWWTGSGVTY